MRIPPLRVFTADGADTEKLGIILANVRGAAERKGDILAQVAATRAAELRLHQIARQHGAGLLQAAMAAIHDRAEEQMRAAITSIPDGEYKGEVSQVKFEVLTKKLHVICPEYNIHKI